MPLNFSESKQKTLFFNSSKHPLLTRNKVQWCNNVPGQLLKSPLKMANVDQFDHSRLKTQRSCCAPVFRSLIILNTNVHKIILSKSRYTLLISDYQHIFMQSTRSDQKIYLLSYQQTQINKNNGIVFFIQKISPFKFQLLKKRTFQWTPVGFGNFLWNKFRIYYAELSIDLYYDHYLH